MPPFSTPGVTHLMHPANSRDNKQQQKKAPFGPIRQHSTKLLSPFLSFYLIINPKNEPKKAVDSKDFWWYFSGSITKCFLDLSWMYFFVLPWPIMHACQSISLIYQRHMAWSLLDVSWIYALVLPWSITNVCLRVSYIYIRMLGLVFPWSIPEACPSVFTNWWLS